MPDLIIHHSEESTGHGKEDSHVHPRINLNSYSAADLLYATEHDVPRETADKCYNHLVLHEANLFRTLWSIVVFFALTYTATVYIYNFCFLTFHIDRDNKVVELPVGLFWRICDAFVDVVFWVDLFANFFFSFRDARGVEEDNLKSVALNYLKGLFWINLMACLPDVITQLTDLRVARLARLERMSRLTRLMRLSRLVRLISLSQEGKFMKKLSSSRYVRLWNFMCGLILSVHVLACGQYLVAALHESDTSRSLTWVNSRGISGLPPFEQWLHAMYFILTIYTTVGFGDISASTEFECIYVSFVMLLGCIVHSIIISEVIQAVTRKDKLQVFTDKTLGLIDAFSAHCQLPWDAQEAMRQEITYRAGDLVTASQINPEEVRELLTGKQLPRWLLAEIPKEVFQGRLMKNRFLHRHGIYMPPRLPCLLASHLQNSQFDAGEVVYQMHDFPFNLFMILKGTFAHVGLPQVDAGGVDRIEEQSTSGMESVDLRLQQKFARSKHKINQTSASQSVAPQGPPACNLSPYRLLCWGSYFGDTEMIEGIPRRSTVRCEQSGESLILHKRDYTTLRAEFPQYGALWNYSARRNEWARKRQLSHLQVARNYQQLAAVLIQRKFRASRTATGQTAEELKAYLEEASFLHEVNRKAISMEQGKDGGVTFEEMKDMRSRIEKLDAKMKFLREEVSQLVQVMATNPTRRSAFFKGPLGQCVSSPSIVR